LVKGLAELHGGEVRVKSGGLGKGAEFEVRLPLEQQVLADAPQAQSQAPLRRAARRILVIEDNVDAADTLREALELENHVVAVAYAGLQGLEVAREFRPEVILCDIGLPGMSGYEVAEAFREDPAFRSTCLVALSGYAGPEDVERARLAGFDEHQAKPPDLDRLLRSLSRLPDGTCGSEMRPGVGASL
jgi:two-component system CheB/CheR fusion protein